jgi:hypothetical protein
MVMCRQVVVAIDDGGGRRWYWWHIGLEKGKGGGDEARLSKA